MNLLWLVVYEDQLIFDPHYIINIVSIIKHFKDIYLKITKLPVQKSIIILRGLRNKN